MKRLPPLTIEEDGHGRMQSLIYVSTKLICLKEFHFIVDWDNLSSSDPAHIWLILLYEHVTECVTSHKSWERNLLQVYILARKPLKIRNLYSCNDKIPADDIIGEHKHSIIKLPPQDISKLNLLYSIKDSLMWQNFWNLFNAAVHSDTASKGIQKLDTFRAAYNA